MYFFGLRGLRSCLIALLAFLFPFPLLAENSFQNPVDASQPASEPSKEFRRPSEPIAVFLSWSDDPCRSMIIRWLTPIEKDGSIETATVKYDKSPHAVALQTQSTLQLLNKSPFNGEKDSESISEWKSYEAISLPLPENNPYLVHSVMLNGLEPNHEYCFKIEGTDILHTFRTAPEKLSSDLTFVIGGDSSQTDDYFKETNIQAAKVDPLFAVIGGDLAYATPGKKNKAEDCGLWITWLKTWYREMQVKNAEGTPSRIIPLIVAIGNHEVKGRYNQTADEAGFFYTLFRYPYQIKSYYALRFSDYLSLYILDSGHTASISGEQKEWIQKEMKQDRLTYHKIATYHVPAYPSVRYYRNSYSSQIRRHWIPIFDKERLHVAFENHDHAYKRTFPLKDSQLHPRGVVYIGDGSWGTKERLPKKANKTSYLATTAKARQFCKVILNYEQRDIHALTSKGVIIDRYTEEVDDVLAKRAKKEEPEEPENVERKSTDDNGEKGEYREDSPR